MSNAENNFKTLIIHGSVNHFGKHDASGAFIPEAKEFALCSDAPAANILALDCVRQKPFRRRLEVEKFAAIHSRGKKADLLAIFCHGWSNGLQIGYGKNSADEFVNVLKTCCRRDVKIVLYACSTASATKQVKAKKIGPGTNGGFADVLRDEMLKQGFRGGWIDAHLTAGHTTRNPFVVRFLTEPIFEDEFDVPGGQWLIQPKTKLWKSWRRALLTDFRFEFPTLQDYEISVTVRMTPY